MVATVGGENDLFPKYFKTLSGLIKAGLKSNDPGVLENMFGCKGNTKSLGIPFVHA